MENSPEERNQEDLKQPCKIRKRKQLTRRDKNLADIFLAFIKGKQKERKSKYFRN